MDTATTPRPVALIILDGYGHNPDSQHNAIAGAHTPVMDQLWAERPRAFVHTDGHHVGLPDGQMGNSEVGHMNLGAGRIVFQDFTRITQAVENGDLDLNPAFTVPIDDAVDHGRAVHLFGLLSPGGVHSHEDHFIALAELAAAAAPSASTFTPFSTAATWRPRAPCTRLSASTPGWPSWWAR